MARRIFSKVLWVGRATSTVLGLAVILALILGVATTALGANAATFKLGQINASNAISSLVGAVAGPNLKIQNTGTGASATALELQVPQGKAPLTVNAGAGTATNLDTDKLDGKDASEFALSTAETWHEVGQQGEPAFDSGWQNLDDGRTATAAFYKDPWGVVHLKGTVKNGSPHGTIFMLPCGYGPNKDQNFAVPSYGANTSNMGIVDVVFVTPACADGTYRAEVRSAQSSATALSLNDVTFRAYGP